MQNPLAMMGSSLEMETFETDVPEQFFKADPADAQAMNTTQSTDLIDTSVTLGDPIQLNSYPDTSRVDENQPLRNKPKQESAQPQLLVVRNKVRIWHVQYYHSYFDVTTKEVKQRLLEALWPFQKIELSQT